MTLREVNRVGEGQKNVPKLRFKGYEDAWEQRKLGEVSQIVGGGTPSTGIPEYWDGDIDWYSPAEIGEEIFVSCSQRKITQLGLEKSSAKILPVGTVLFTSRAGIGDTAILEKEGCTNQGFQSIVPKANELDSYFIFSCSHLLKKYGETRGAGSTFVEISGKQMSLMPLNIPEIKEQKSVGNFFKKLDSIITLHQRKYDALKSMKKTLLSKMFPKNGEDVPEIRFKGFTDTWEQRKAKRLFVSWVDKGYPDLPVLSATQDKGMVRRDENGINIHYDEKNKSAYKRVMPGQFVIHLRSFQGGFAYSEVEGITSPAYTVFDFQEFDKHIPEFWKYVFSSKDFIRRLEKVTYGIRDGRSIGFEDFLTLKFNVPEKREQKVIAEILARVNKLITLHQRKLEELKNMKKTLLQQMFV